MFYHKTIVFPRFRISSGLIVMVFLDQGRTGFISFPFFLWSMLYVSWSSKMKSPDSGDVGMPFAASRAPPISDGRTPISRRVAQTIDLIWWRTCGYRCFNNVVPNTDVSDHQGNHHRGLKMARFIDNSSQSVIRFIHFSVTVWKSQMVTASSGGSPMAASSCGVSVTYQAHFVVVFSVIALMWSDELQDPCSFLCKMGSCLELNQRSWRCWRPYLFINVVNQLIRCFSRCVINHLCKSAAAALFRQRLSDVFTQLICFLKTRVSPHRSWLRFGAVPLMHCLPLNYKHIRCMDGSNKVVSISALIGKIKHFQNYQKNK